MGGIVIGFGGSGIGVRGTVERKEGADEVVYAYVHLSQAPRQDPVGHDRALGEGRVGWVRGCWGLLGR